MTREENDFVFDTFICVGAYYLSSDRRAVPLECVNHCFSSIFSSIELERAKRMEETGEWKRERHQVPRTHREEGTKETSKLRALNKRHFIANVDPSNVVSRRQLAV